MSWVAKSQIRFEDPKAADSSNKGEVWGKIDDNLLTINRDVLLDFLDKNGYDYTAVSRKWDEKGYLKRNSQGKFIHCTKVYGIKSSYIKFNLPQDDNSADENEFMQVDEDEDLPFK